MQINFPVCGNHTSTSNEIVACCIHLENQSIILISAYRPPNSNFEYLDTLCPTISSIILANPNDIICLGGDLTSTGTFTA